MGFRRERRLLNTGTQAPQFQLTATDGSQTTLADWTARGSVLVVFFKVNCPVCQMTLPFLERLHASGKLAVCGISQNSARDTREFNREFGITFPTLLDPEDADFPASNAYGIASVPTLFLAEADGVISRVIEGWNRQEMETLSAARNIVLFRADDNVPAWKAG